MSLTALGADIDLSTDGRRLVRVQVRRQTENPAREPELEIVYEIIDHEDVTLSSETFALSFLSATRTDTREPIILSPEESRRVLQIAAGELTPSVLC